MADFYKCGVEDLIEFFEVTRLSKNKIILQTRKNLLKKPEVQEVLVGTEFEGIKK